MHKHGNRRWEGHLQEPGASWTTVVATVGEIETTLNKWLSQHHGLGLTDYRALTLLSEASDHELRITELATQVGLNQSSTTRLVVRLETKGLVVRDSCPDDGRGIYAVITEPGLALVRELTETYNERLEALLTSAIVTDTAKCRAFRTVAHFPS